MYVRASTIAQPPLVIFLIPVSHTRVGSQSYAQREWTLAIILTRVDVSCCEAERSETKVHQQQRLQRCAAASLTPLAGLVGTGRAEHTTHYTTEHRLSSRLSLGSLPPPSSPRRSPPPVYLATRQPTWRLRFLHPCFREV